MFIFIFTKIALTEVKKHPKAWFVLVWLCPHFGRLPSGRVGLLRDV
jgi:hypothetical protein